MFKLSRSPLLPSTFFAFYCKVSNFTEVLPGTNFNKSNNFYSHAREAMEALTCMSLVYRLWSLGRSDSTCFFCKRDVDIA